MQLTLTRLLSLPTTWLGRPLLAFRWEKMVVSAQKNNHIIQTLPAEYHTLQTMVIMILECDFDRPHHFHPPAQAAFFIATSSRVTRLMPCRAWCLRLVRWWVVSSPRTTTPSGKFLGLDSTSPHSFPIHSCPTETSASFQKKNTPNQRHQTPQNQLSPHRFPAPSKRYHRCPHRQAHPASHIQRLTFLQRSSKLTSCGGQNDKERPTEGLRRKLKHKTL